MDKKEIIFHTAAELFASRGLQQTSMAQISKESKVPVGSIYRRFESKDELIKELYLYMSQQMGQAIHFTSGEMELAYQDRFVVGCQKLLDFYQKHPTYFLLKNTLKHSPLIDSSTQQKSQAYYQQSVDLIVEGIQKGIFIKVDEKLALRFVNAGISMLMQLQLDDDFALDQKAINQGISMIWNGLHI